MRSLGGWKGLAASGMLLLGSAPGPARANERRFTYAYESGTMTPGAREIELWSTWRNGRAGMYSRFDHRAEAEFGLTDRLLTAFYLNWRRVVAQNPANPQGTVNSGEFTGISSEWKYKLLDPVADPLGLAVYQEYSVGADEFEWENRLILDKKIGGTLLAYNLVMEPEWEFTPGKAARVIGVENDLALTRFLTPRFSAGLEVRNHNEYAERGRGFEHGALFAGPVLSCASENWWVTGTFLGQLHPLRGSRSNPQDGLVLDEHEKINVRVLVSTRF